MVLLSSELKKAFIAKRAYSRQTGLLGFLVLLDLLQLMLGHPGSVTGNPDVNRDNIKRFISVKFP
jgi:hypothetical protein